MCTGSQVKCRFRNFTLELDDLLRKFASILERISRKTFPVIFIVVVAIFIPRWPGPGGPDMVAVFKFFRQEDGLCILVTKNFVIPQGR